MKEGLGVQKGSLYNWSTAVCQGVGVGLGVVSVVLIHLLARPVLQLAATPVSEFWLFIYTTT